MSGTEHANAEEMMVEPEQIELEVARIIDPVAMRKYEDAKASGRKAANGRLWADVAYATDRDIAVQKARAVMAALRGGK